jgi:ketosteroid isomerase-like protein
MSDANVELVRRSFEALMRGDFERAFAAHHPEIEWLTAADEPDRRSYRGRDGLERLVSDLADPWEDRFGRAAELGELSACGTWVVVPWRARLHGRGSGLEIEVFETYAVLVLAGSIVRVEEYRTTEEALEAVRGRGARAP